MMTFDDVRAKTAALATWRLARRSLDKFCTGKGTMCVPVQPDDDDLVIGAMLDRGERLETERAALVAVARAALRSVQMATMGSDGQTAWLWLNRPSDSQQAVINSLAALPPSLRAELWPEKEA